MSVRAQSGRIFAGSFVLLVIAGVLFMFGSPGTPRNLLDDDERWPNIRLYVPPNTIASVNIQITRESEEVDRIGMNFEILQKARPILKIGIQKTGAMSGLRVDQKSDVVKLVGEFPDSIEVVTVHRVHYEFQFESPAFAYYQDNARVQARGPYVFVHTCEALGERSVDVVRYFARGGVNGCAQETTIPVRFAFIFAQEYNVRTDYASPAPDAGTNNVFTCVDSLQCAAIGNYVLIDEEARGQIYIFISGVAIGLATTGLGIGVELWLGGRRRNHGPSDRSTG